MKPQEYKWGVYPTAYKSLRTLSFAVHLVFEEKEKYIEFEFMYWSLAIGKTAI
jgi:hypothetical protein